MNSGRLPGLGADQSLWNGERPKCAPPHTLRGPTGQTVDKPVYVLSEDNFERAEQAIAFCMAHGLMAAGRN